MTLPAAEPSASLLAPSSPGLMARVGRRFMEAPRAVSGLPGTARRMSLKLQAGMAEFLLVTRLRARNQKARPALSADVDVLERGAHVVDVTCRHWFAAPGGKRAASPGHRTRL
jgi:hypothetical protein